MPVPVLLANAVTGILRRYGIKKLAGESAKKFAKRAKGKAVEWDVDVPTAKKKLRRRDVGGRILNTAGVVGTVDLVFDTMDFSSKKELRTYVKKNKPKLWQEFSASEYNDIEKFLKNKKA